MNYHKWEPLFWNPCLISLLKLLSARTGDLARILNLRNKYDTNWQLTIFFCQIDVEISKATLKCSTKQCANDYSQHNGVKLSLRYHSNCLYLWNFKRYFLTLSINRMNKFDHCDWRLENYQMRIHNYFGLIMNLEYEKEKYQSKTWIYQFYLPA